jgi:hypothetical protein
MTLAMAAWLIAAAVNTGVAAAGYPFNAGCAALAFGMFLWELAE